MDLLDLELAALLLGAWVISLFVLWKVIDRPGRPGIVKGPFVIDAMMLASLACLVIGVSFLIKGSGLFT